MKKFLKDHTNTVLIVLVVLFLIIIVGYFVWGIGYIASEVNTASNDQPPSTPVSDFNLKAAATLDYRGLMN